MSRPATLTAEQIAWVAHEAIRAYCLAIGDDSQVGWGHAPEWQRQSEIAGVQAVAEGRARTPEEQHEAWMRDKLRAGWTYGPVKDPVRKLHPCLLPYDQLAPEQRRKDVLFRMICTVLLEPLEPVPVWTPDQSDL